MGFLSLQWLIFICIYTNLHTYPHAQQLLLKLPGVPCRGRHIRPGSGVWLVSNSLGIRWVDFPLSLLLFLLLVYITRFSISLKQNFSYECSSSSNNNWQFQLTNRVRRCAGCFQGKEWECSHTRTHAYQPTRVCVCARASPTAVAEVRTGAQQPQIRRL